MMFISSICVFADESLLEFNNMKKAIFILLATVILWFIFLRNDTVRFGPGVLAPDPPKQVNNVSPKSFSFKDYTITPLSKFYIKAKILSKKNYRRGRESDLSPVDLALGWGRMSDQSVLDFIDISQSNRWYRWRTDNFPIPRKEIETHSGNMHLIPANQSVKAMIKRARKGDIVEFSGSLVRIDAKDGWHWISSLSRMDTGGHSCELVWVENFNTKEF